MNRSTSLLTMNRSASLPSLTGSIGFYYEKHETEENEDIAAGAPPSKKMKQEKDNFLHDGIFNCEEGQKQYSWQIVVWHAVSSPSPWIMYQSDQWFDSKAACMKDFRDKCSNYDSPDCWTCREVIVSRTLVRDQKKFICW